MCESDQWARQARMQSRMSRIQLRYLLYEEPYGRLIAEDDADGHCQLFEVQRFLAEA